jgi:hypothetical protein
MHSDWLNRGELRLSQASEMTTDYSVHSRRDDIRNYTDLALVIRGEPIYTARPKQRAKGFRGPNPNQELRFQNGLVSSP